MFISPSLSAAGNHWSFYYLLSFPFSRLPYCWNHTEFSFLNELLSLSNIYLRFLGVFSWLNGSFLLNIEWYPLSEWNRLFINSPTKGHFGCFHILAIMKKTTVNIFVQILGEYKHSGILTIRIGVYHTVVFIDISMFQNMSLLLNYGLSGKSFKYLDVQWELITIARLKP
jgi:hypothetical protein